MHGHSPGPQAAPTWTFASRVRGRVFGRMSDLAIQRLDEATADIRARVRKGPVAAANGALRTVERLSPAFDNVDDSSDI